MLASRENGATLTVVYRPRGFAIVAGVLFAIGVVFLLIGLAQHHEARLTCEGERCTLERSGVLSSERVDVRKLRRAETTPQELMLRADPDVVMGPWVARRGVSSYERAVTSINAYIDGGRSGVLDVKVPVRGTIRWIGFGALGIILGIGLGAVYAIGARAVLDRKRDEVRRFGSRIIVKLSDVTGIELRNKQIVATLREGHPAIIVGALKSVKTSELEAMADRIRRFVQG